MTDINSAAHIVTTLTGPMRIALTEGSCDMISRNTSPNTVKALGRRFLVLGGRNGHLTVEGQKVRALLVGDADADHAEALVLNRHHDENAASQARIDALHIPLSAVQLAEAHGEALMMDHVINQARRAEKARAHKAELLEQAHAEALSENALRDEFGAATVVAQPAIDGVDLVDIARSIIVGDTLGALELIWSLADEATRARLVASAERLAMSLAKDIGVYSDGTTEATDEQATALELAKRLNYMLDQMTRARAARFAATWPASLRLAQRLINTHSRMGAITYEAVELNALRIAVRAARKHIR